MTSSALGGRCFQFDATTITRESLIAEGIRPEAADELLAFARLLFAKRARHAASCAWHRNDPAGCDCGLAAMERTLLARTDVASGPAERERAR